MTDKLTVAPNGRHLEREDGTPFLYLADTAWELFHRLDREEADRYLADRAAKGFTVIQAVVLAELDGLTAPNANGDLPLEDLDPTRPVEAYFAHVDSIVRRANELGLVVGMLPTWGRYWKRVASSETGPGVGAELEVFDEANARSYGEWLGKRYRGADLIWILGGDRDIDTTDERTLLDAMAAGLASGDGGAHLRTFHPRGPGRSGEQLTDAAWLDFHMCQTSHGAVGHDTGIFIEADRAIAPDKPVVDGEPRYENIPVGFYNRGNNPAVRFTDYDARTAAWWAILAGGAGHTYGNNNIWQMYDEGREPIIGAAIPWHRAIAHPGSAQMGYMRELLEAVGWWKLVPAPLGGVAQGGEVAAGGRGSLPGVAGTAGADGGSPGAAANPGAPFLVDAPFHGPAKVRAALAEDGTAALVYSPKGEPFTLRLTALRPGRVRERWFNPRYGTLHEIHTGAARGFQTYAPPASGDEADWVLVMEAV